MKAVQSTEEYIQGFPDEVQMILRQIREVIQEAAPDAEELISYQIPAYRQNGILMYFAGYAHHVSVYPAPTGIPAFEKKIAPYFSGKGTLRFPIDQPIPYTLIADIVRYRVRENSKKASAKSSKEK